MSDAMQARFYRRARLLQVLSRLGALVGAALLIGTVALATPASAAGTMTLTPSSGPPGTFVALSGNNCLSKSGATAVTATGHKGSSETHRQEIQVNQSDGTWLGGFIIPVDAAQGDKFEFRATCKLSSGATVFTYSPVTFTTALVPSSGGSGSTTTTTAPATTTTAAPTTTTTAKPATTSTTAAPQSEAPPTTASGSSGQDGAVAASFSDRPNPFGGRGSPGRVGELPSTGLKAATFSGGVVLLLGGVVLGLMRRAMVARTA